jgi:hypothetical protein
MKSIKLSIEKPCSTGAENFYPVGSGYYCTLCQKEVQDFTHYSNRELLEAFSENTDTSCGIFRKGQLDKKIKPPDEHEFSLAKLLLSGLLITTELCLAQSDIKMDSTVAVTKDSLEISDDSLSVTSDTASIKEDTLINTSIENPHPEINITPTTDLIQSYILGDFIVSGNISYIDNYSAPGALIDPGLLFNPPKDTIVEVSENLNSKSVSEKPTETPEPEEDQTRPHPLWAWIEERKRKIKQMTDDR